MKSGKFTSLELVTGAVKTVGLFCELWSDNLWCKVKLSKIKAFTKRFWLFIIYYIL
jgi:hypothetical protein